MTGAATAKAARDPRVAALAAFHGRRKQDSRARLLAAAATVFCARGYHPVSVDEIASAAGVSRMTFYRHFASKAGLAADLFDMTTRPAMPRMLAVTLVDYGDPDVVAGWLRDVFAADRRDRRLLRVFMEATAEQGFTERAHGLIEDLIAGLGKVIPAFAASGDDPGQRRQWLESWLLLFEILDQSNHAALESGIAGDPLVIEILAERFTAFAGRHAT